MFKQNFNFNDYTKNNIQHKIIFSSKTSMKRTHIKHTHTHTISARSLLSSFTHHPALFPATSTTAFIPSLYASACKCVRSVCVCVCVCARVAWVRVACCVLRVACVCSFVDCVVLKLLGGRLGLFMD